MTLLFFFIYGLFQVYSNLWKCLNLFSNSDEQCGKPKVGKQTIFGGTEVERGAYPW